MMKTKPASKKLSLTPPKPAGQMRRTQTAEPEPSLTRMVRFVETLADEAIVVTLSQQLSWSHFLALLPIKDPLARDFYAEIATLEARCDKTRALRA